MAVLGGQYLWGVGEVTLGLADSEAERPEARSPNRSSYSTGGFCNEPWILH